MEFGIFYSRILCHFDEGEITVEIRQRFDCHYGVIWGFLLFRNDNISLRIGILNFKTLEFTET